MNKQKLKELENKIEVTRKAINEENDNRKKVDNKQQIFIDTINEKLDLICSFLKVKIEEEDYINIIPQHDEYRMGYMIPVPCIVPEKKEVKQRLIIKKVK